MIERKQTFSHRSVRKEAKRGKALLLCLFLTSCYLFNCIVIFSRSRFRTFLIFLFHCIFSYYPSSRSKMLAIHTYLTSLQHYIKSNWNSSSSKMCCLCNFATRHRAGRRSESKLQICSCHSNLHCPRIRHAQSSRVRSAFPQKRKSDIKDNHQCHHGSLHQLSKIQYSTIYKPLFSTPFND